jgi:hypothetical protein
MAFPGVPAIEIARRVNGVFDAAIIMECSDLARTGVEGLDQYFVINIDHHPGNAGYGQINWFDASAAACAEMVYDLIGALGVPRSVEIATHVYLAISQTPKPPPGSRLDVRHLPRGASRRGRSGAGGAECTTATAWGACGCSAPC